MIITAATSSSAVVSDAFQACRRKGRVVIVGDVGLELKRHDMYEKELDAAHVDVVRPGPLRRRSTRTRAATTRIGYVRWTENRNMEEYLRLLAERRVALGAPAARSATASTRRRTRTRR